MRITVIPKIGRETKHIPLEVESSDTVGNVKAKIEETEWIHRDANRLIYSETSLQDNRSLEDYDIQEESTLLLVLKLGVPLIYIKNWIGKMFALDFRRQSLSLSTSVVYDIKQKVEEKEGIPPDKQRLYFAGKLLDDTRTLADYDIKYGFILYLDRIPDDDAIVDIAAIQARWRAARSKAKVTGDESEPVIMLANGDSKRARGDSSYTPPQSSTGGLLLYGANRKNGVESFWDEEDFGLARRRSQALISRYDINRFECIDDRTLIESVANSSVRMLNVTAVLEHRLQEYKDTLKQVRNEVEQLSKEGAHVKELLENEEDGNKKLRQELEMERSTGTFFLQSVAGRHRIATLEKSAIDDFKKSGAFQEVLMEHGVKVYDKAVKEFQRLLRESGRVSEDIVQLIDPQESEQETRIGMMTRRRRSRRRMTTKSKSIMMMMRKNYY